MKPEKIARIEITAETLKDIRLLLNMSQAVFSKCLGISIRQLSRIETGEANLSKTLQILSVLIYREVTGKKYE